MYRKDRDRKGRRDAVRRQYVRYLNDLECAGCIGRDYRERMEDEARSLTQAGIRDALNEERDAQARAAFLKATKA